MTEEKTDNAADQPVVTNVALPVSLKPDGFAVILESVTRKIASSAKGTGLVGAPLQEAISEVVTTAAREAVETGGDLLFGTKAIIMGVVRGTGATKEAALQTVAHAARIIIHHTADRNGNLAAAIKGIVLGAIASARAMGVETARAASMAAQGALEGASEAGSVTVERVLGALKEPIGGNKVVLPEPLAT
jgi:hypothetical protein